MRRAKLGKNKDRVLLLHEFGPTSRDWHQGQVVEELRGRGWVVEWAHGRLADYQAGGTGLRRLGNLLYCYGTFPWRMVRLRPAAVLVRTAPPGIQLWMSFWGWVLRVRVVWWLMDYHPEMEARMLEGRQGGAKGAAGLLRWIDRWCLKRTYAVIAIDEAMAEVVRSRSGKPRVRVYPTWSPGIPADLPARASHARSRAKEVRVLHLGNFGFAHDLRGIVALVERAPADWRFRFWVVNPSERGRLAFAKLGEHPQVSVQFSPKLSQEDLLALIDRERIGWGLVPLDPRFGGTVSPSKFHTYLDLSLPLLYAGPPGTNAWKYCEEYGAGVTITVPVTKSAISLLCHLQENEEAGKHMRESVARAQEAMHCYGPVGLCVMLEELLNSHPTSST